MKQPDMNLPDFNADRLRAPTGWRRFLRSKPLLIGGGLAIAALVLLVALPGGSSDHGGRYRTEAASRGKLVVTISASGTLQPTRSVDVGCELSGTLEAVLANENDHVRKGQVVARLDTSKLRDAVAKSAAAVAAAEAGVLQAEATVAEARASLGRLRHVAELSGGKVPSKTELETAEATYQRAVANVASAKATVTQARAALKTDETNIDKAVIRAQTDGVVLTRKVEPGQTIVAAMTTPVLFTIAEDLTKMELQVKVDEADVGSVKLGQSANFTVSAWPGRKFPATLQRVGLGSTTTDNVVTYKTVLSVANDDLALRPGMTATARIVTAQRDDVLLVPNAALRFTPPDIAGEAPSGSFLSRLLPRPPQPRKTTPASSTTDAKQVWTLQDGRPVAIAVQTGASNGRQTEITGGELKDGMAIIVDYQEAPR
ncbi:efflux RND transporter periplasmic adaptor subunit [Propionivibrio dicarboxylicus]|uniref:HlyD family secretion protein n=1 Tax=Propionivibrio dicarboxylicus TaxID=83767 RepID=A0A1G7VPW7_9RHOO|nr:efflux RND transporter periplasmic adaptor subunit [Propionivibrio dicarboxylicus]SDG61774.1 HlyD family secretion protein [Propionivibrio dicarboxylicus]